MATIKSGARSTADLSTQRLVVDIADGISLLDPNENPMTLLTRKVGKRVAKQPKFSWLEDVLQPETDQLDMAGNALITDTELTVDDGTKFAAGQLWQVFDSYEIMHVVSVAGNVITVDRNYPGVASGHTGYQTALTNNDWFIKIGNANAEGSGAPTALSTVEEQVDNYTQIFKTPFRLTETELNSLMEGEQDLPYQTRKKGIEHAREIEYSFFWGLPSYANTGANGKPKRTMGGLWWFLKENAPAANLASQAEITSAEFMAWLRACFFYGSSRKVLFACPLVLSAIESWGFAKLNTYTTDKQFGINITKWVSPHGEIAIINHKMLAGPNPGTVGGWAFLLDMDNVKYVHLRNRDTKLITGIQDNDADEYAAQYLTECSLQVKLPETHGVLYSVTSFAA